MLATLIAIARGTRPDEDDLRQAPLLTHWRADRRARRRLTGYLPIPKRRGRGEKIAVTCLVTDAARKWTWDGNSFFRLQDPTSA